MNSYMEIDILEQEYWWGGTVQDGVSMPYTKTNFKRDLSKEQLYNQSVPILLSNKGRYVWCEEPFSFSFIDNKLIITSNSSDIIVSSGHENLRGAFLDASGKYFPPDGKYPDQLMFTAPQYNTWIEMMYEPTQEKVLAYAKAIIDNGMPPGILIIDDNWQEDYGVWSFHPGRFPQPKAMIAKLHEMGFKVMLWICNFVSADSLTARTIDKLGYLVKNQAGKAAMVEWWNGRSAMLDLTREAALEWFKLQLNSLMLNYGVDGFKFDAGDLAHFSDSFILSKAINGNQYSEAWGKIGLDYELNEYRACWKLGGKALAQRLSDKSHCWELINGLGSLIPNGLAQGLMGYAFTCPDMIGGGEYLNFLENSNNLDKELIIRNVECAALFPMMQFSAAPWRVLDKEQLNICVEMAKLHVRFSDRIVELAKEASKTGEPIIRHMEYVFPGNGYEKIIDQFMLGDKILVAPVLKKGATSRSIVFPRGKWIGDDKTVVQGPCTITVDAPIERLPWYEKVDTSI
ncbi:glycoside hydrolase family 31 protein [Clostridium swellfunianum]|uniref:glycoside hydrolase family 31 protein n=1 Tax=Clostridium swellfunianum TaxID=1367462 RepID=UPI00202E6043|nr:glycoside hydrolase family 31 protein [Clostridium swellfunianum]MCM0647318.1 glycoside hydrolase family 31 protein [Clostridium swellfunianum]